MLELEVSVKESSGYLGWMFVCVPSTSPGNNEDKLSLFGGARREFKIIFTLKGTMSTWNLICCGPLIASVGLFGISSYYTASIFSFILCSFLLTKGLEKIVENREITESHNS